MSVVEGAQERISSDAANTGQTNAASLGGRSRRCPALRVGVFVAFPRSEEPSAPYWTPPWAASSVGRAPPLRRGS